MTATIKKLGTKKSGTMIKRSKTVSKSAYVKLKKDNAKLKMALVIFSFALILSLSVMSNFLFFKELLASSVIITLLAGIKFFSE